MDDVTAILDQLNPAQREAVLHGKDFKVEVTFRNRFGRERRYPITSGWR